MVVLTEMEHHANLVPWLALKAERGIELRYLPLTDDGLLDLIGPRAGRSTAPSSSASPPCRMCSAPSTPSPELAEAAHAAGALILVDGAQQAPHLPTDVQAIGVDFFGCTGHKMLGPTGIGGLWARRELLDAMPPFLGGGEMIRDVRLDGFTDQRRALEVRGGHAADRRGVGLDAAAVDYLSGLGMPAVREHERSLTEYALGVLTDRYPI